MIRFLLYALSTLLINVGAANAFSWD